MARSSTGRWRALFVPLGINILLPLAIYYALRAQDIAQWKALLLSSVIPAAHALGTAVVRRRVEAFDLLMVVLLAASAATSLISGSPRILLLKDAGIPAALALWILGSLFAARPFPFHFARRMRDPAGQEEADRAWDVLPDFRAALRGLTLLWGGSQLLDASLSTLEALTLPVDLVPVVGRFQSFAILGVVAALTVRRSRAFRAGSGVPLFGIRTPVASQD
ncbi:VC0807 family protein [Streptomyces sp. CT34]|uniref:VC0807 family protein n=1 Tax=Streptomyces sp. CT34 TaxID=1553907 RepID=UPI000B09A2A4|nr:VC0807 family protein [Streptomyces sp. CT34]